MRSNIPVLISGVYRSGTTFANAAMSCFEGYSSLSSGLKFMRFCFGLYGESLDNERQLNALLADCHLRLMHRWNIAIPVEKIVSQTLDRGMSYSVVYDLLIREILGINDEKTSYQWCDKLVLGWDSVESFLELFPDGVVIHLIRNPLDVLKSFENMTSEPRPIYLDAILNCYSSFSFVENIPPKWSDRIIVCKVKELYDSNSDVYQQLSTMLKSSFDRDKFESGQFSTMIDEWQKNTTRLDSISIGGKPSSLDSNADFTQLEAYLLEELCGSYMDKFAFSRHYKVSNLSQSDVEELLGYKYLIGRYRMAVNGKDPGPSYYTNPVDLEWSIVNEKAGNKK